MKYFRFLVSLKTAVVTILAIAASCTAGTFIESLYDTRTAQYYVYRSPWFLALLIFFGTIIAAVAISRFPWKPRHIPFLIAHLGILILLYGSWVTYQYGVDGSLQVAEGEAEGVVHLPEQMLYLVDEDSGNLLERREVPWVPPGVEFSGMVLEHHDLRVDRFIPHAEPVFQFSAARKIEGSAPSDRSAVSLKISGGPLPVQQEIWLYGGDASWRSLQVGPVFFVLIPSHRPDILKAFESAKASGTRFAIRVSEDGVAHYVAISKSGRIKKGRVQLKSDPSGKVQSVKVHPGWMAGRVSPNDPGIAIEFKKILPYAENTTQYRASRVQYGQDAPAPAIRLTSLTQGGVVWLGLGDRALFVSGEKKLRISFGEKQIRLPFNIALERFHIDRYQGTQSPATFRSKIRLDEKEIEISMNEPLVHKGFTFYQSSYIPADPRPTISVFSVNRDPGRWIKYLGSILLVLGSALLFTVKWIKRKMAGRLKGSASGSLQPQGLSSAGVVHG